MYRTLGAWGGALHTDFATTMQYVVVYGMAVKANCTAKNDLETRAYYSTNRENRAKNAEENW